MIKADTNQMYPNMSSVDLKLHLCGLIDARKSIRRFAMERSASDSTLADVASVASKTLPVIQLADRVLEHSVQNNQSIPDLRILFPSIFSFDERNVRKELLLEFGTFSITSKQRSVKFILELRETLADVPSVEAGYFYLFESRESREQIEKDRKRVIEAVLAFPYILYCFHQVQLATNRHKKELSPLLFPLVLAGQSEFLSRLYQQPKILYAEIESAQIIRQFRLLKYIRDLETFRLFFPDVSLSIYEKENSTLHHKRRETFQRFLWDGNRFENDLPHYLMYLLRFYITHGNVDIVQHIAKVTKLSGQSIWSQILYMGAKKGHTSIISLALKHDARFLIPPNLQSVFLSFKDQHEHALMAAIRHQWVHAVKIIIASPLYSHQEFIKSENNDPLIEGVRSGNKKTVKLLLSAGCDPNVLLEHESPLALSITQRTYSITQLLLKVGADPNISPSPFPFYPIHIAAFSSDRGSMKLLLENGADPNLPDNFGHTALMKAVQKKDIALCRLLLDHGANPHTVNANRVPIVVFVRKYNENFDYAYNMLLSEYAD